jgi:hypothetical protein
VKILVDGTTATGVHVLVREPETQRYEVEIDGAPVPYSSASRLRDGGTTTIQTERGEIHAHRQIHTEPWDAFNGERLTSPPAA